MSNWKRLDPHAGRMPRACTGIRAAVAGSLFASVTGCAVGPDFTTPEPPLPTKWNESPAQGTAVPTPAQAAENGTSKWWLQFRDSKLTELIERAIKQNLDLRISLARIEQARASRTIAGADFYPNLSGSAQYRESRTVKNGSAIFAGGGSGGGVAVSSGGSNSVEFFQYGFDAAWELDVFGRIRRNVEAQDAALLSEAESFRALALTTAGDVSARYLNVRTLQQRLRIARENVTAQDQTRSLVEERKNVGFANGLDLENAKAQRATTASQVPLLEGQLRAEMYSLAVLVNSDLGSVARELDADAPEFPHLTPLPVGIPSELLRRRPDIRMADARLHQATALIGVARAALFPRLSLSGSLFLQGSDSDRVSDWQQHLWSYGSGLTLPILNAGRLQAGVRSQEAARDQALASYEKSVLVALQEVETAIAKYRTELDRRQALEEAVDAQTRAVEASRELYREGLIEFLNVLTAERTLFQAQDQLAQSKQAVATNFVMLSKALGGGLDELDLSRVEGLTE